MVERTFARDDVAIRVSGRPVLPRAFGVHRSIFRTRSGVLPFCHRLVANLLAWNRSPANDRTDASGADARGSGHRSVSDSFLSYDSRKRRQPDESRAVHLQWPHPDSNGNWKIHDSGAGDWLWT